MLSRMEGIVIRSMDYGEGNKIVSLFTEAAGKVSVMVRGAKKTNSRFAAVAQLFTHGDFVFFKSGHGGMGTLNNAELIEGYQKLREDLYMAAYGAYIAEMYERLMPEQESHPMMFIQLKAAMDALAEGKDGMIVIHIVEMKMLALSGYLPQLDACVSCGSDISLSTEGPQHVWLSVNHGGAICQRCRHTDPQALRVTQAAFKLLRLFQRIDLRRLGSVEIKPATKAELKQCMRAFMDAHLDMRWKSRGFIEQMDKYLT